MPLPLSTAGEVRPFRVAKDKDSRGNKPSSLLLRGWGFLLGSDCGVQLLGEILKYIPLTPLNHPASREPSGFRYEEMEVWMGYSTGLSHRIA